MSTRNRLLITGSILVALCSLIVVGGYWQYKELQLSDQQWRIASAENVEKIKLLSDLERLLGYRGFIHTFKNYVLRREERYYQDAVDKHKALMSTIEQIKSTGALEDKDLIEIKATVNLYFRNLTYAKDIVKKGIDPAALDKLVKVDDEPASEALARVREKIMRLSNLSYIRAAESQAQLKNWTYTYLGIAIILVIGLSMFLYRILSTYLSLKRKEKAMVDGAPLGVLLIDKEGYILSANQHAQSLFQYPASELHGRNISSLVPEESRDKHLVYLGESMKSEFRKTTHVDGRPIQCITKNENIIPVEVTFSTFLSGGAEMKCWVYIRELVAVSQTGMTEEEGVGSSVALHQQLSNI
ncbi:MAG: PAS domain-containing protein [Gammaproteobacteria bacterium]|nr:PAS domain-containing protein [Gammaproteobacteria bacterium]